MAVPTVMSDLSTTAASNSPAGSESPTAGDDFLRAIQSIVRTTNAKGSDIASASTTDIGAATAEFVDVTGTTTITALGTIAAGIVRTVRFTGALTLTYNATSLILPGSANITTANGDTAIFRSLGSGNWVCISYVKRDGTQIVSQAPFIDSTAIIKGSGDATKLVRIEADGITTATTRVWTAQDRDITVAGLIDIVPVRQTVISGPVDTSGYSAFVGATGSTTVTMTGTLVVTAANGTLNRTGTGTNLSWTGLSTNGTMYLFADVGADGTLTTASSTLSPTYRWGGADVTTNGQFTFNIQEMVGKVGNGSVATQTYRVAIGEVTVAGGVVTVITWYALMGRARSNSLGTPNTSTQFLFSHNIGVSSPRVMGILRNITTELSYVAGDEVHIETGMVIAGVTVAARRLAAQLWFGSNSIGIGGWGTAGANITLANWNVYLYVDRGW